jgi:hypothetical protein
MRPYAILCRHHCSQIVRHASRLCNVEQDHVRAMLCDVMLCCAMLCHAMLCHAMLCYAMLCHACAMSSRITCVLGRTNLRGTPASWPDTRAPFRALLDASRGPEALREGWSRLDGQLAKYRGVTAFFGCTLVDTCAGMPATP